MKNPRLFSLAAKGTPPILLQHGRNCSGPDMVGVIGANPFRLEIECRMRLYVPWAHRIFRTPQSSHFRMFPGERTHDLAAFGTAVVHPELPAAHGVLPFMTAYDAAPYNLPLAPALNVVGRVLFTIYCAKPFLCKLGIRFTQVLLVRGCFRLNPPADHATIVEVAVRGLIRMMSVGTNEMSEPPSSDGDALRRNVLVLCGEKFGEICDGFPLQFGVAIR